MACADLPSVIAIDGPAAAGKSTVGRALAERYGYVFLDTGLMYRAFTVAALRSGVPPEDQNACTELARTLSLTVAVVAGTRILLDGEDVTGRLRDPEVEASVSAYSAVVGVREEMVRQQRAIAARHRAILAGRDIGTVVLPDAPLKIYLDAKEDVRAERRSKQAGEWQVQRDAETSRRDIVARDRVDSSRPVAPLRPAEDAVYIDTTNLTLDQVVASIGELLTCGD